MKTNHTQFAVVREDPRLELSLIEQFGLQSAVLIGSAGCTALSIKAYAPSFRIDLIEPNPEQITLIQEKIDILSEIDLEYAKKIIAINGPLRLIEAGNFESLCKMFRTFIYEFVIEEEEFRELFEVSVSEKWKQVFLHPYWKTAFELFFSSTMLVKIFGPSLLQYSVENSYPSYFQECLEKGLCRKDAKDNYFLHHIFFGQYFDREEALPAYLQKEIQNFQISLHSCSAQEFANYGDFDLIGLSNILDWSAPGEMQKLAAFVSRSMKKGSVLLYRQLNNDSDFKPHFTGISWQDELEDKFLQMDRSLFYSKICIGIKN